MRAADCYFQHGWLQRNLVRVYNAKYGVERVANRLVVLGMSEEMNKRMRVKSASLLRD